MVWSAGFLWPPQSESLRLVRMLSAMVPGHISPRVGLADGEFQGQHVSSSTPLSPQLCCNFQVTDGEARACHRVLRHMLSCLR